MLVLVYISWCPLSIFPYRVLISHQKKKKERKKLMGQTNITAEKMKYCTVETLEFEFDKGRN